MLKISIPEPCHEDWAKMTPNEQGRHCTACAKTVVDFTGMSDEAVKNFFLNKKEERVCGRFRNEQLQRISIELPQNIFYIPMPFWKKFLVASLLAFSATLFSCDTQIQENKTLKQEKTEIVGALEIMPPTKDSTKSASADTSIKPTPPLCNETVGITSVRIVQEITQGEPAVEPVRDSITPVIELGKVEMIEPPPANKTKKPDTINCNKQTYY